MVLRHGADRDGRAARSAYLGDPGRVDRRPRLVGGHRPHGPGRPARDLAHGTATRARNLMPEDAGGRRGADAGLCRSAALLRRGGRTEHPELPPALRRGMVSPGPLAGERGRTRLLHLGQHGTPSVAGSPLPHRHSWPCRPAGVRHRRRRALRRQPGRHHGCHRRRQRAGRTVSGRRCGGGLSRLLRGGSGPLLPPTRLGFPSRSGAWALRREQPRAPTVTGLIDAPTSPPSKSSPGLDPTQSSALLLGAPERGRIDLATRCRPLLRPTAYYLLSRAAVFGTALVATSFI